MMKTIFTPQELIKHNYFMNCRTPQSCIRVKIEHTIDEPLMLSPEARKAKWDRSMNNE